MEILLLAACTALALVLHRAIVRPVLRALDVL